ncbi:MAG: PfkB family carbohydrate kinase [Kineosporiaceae bacterium]
MRSGVLCAGSIVVDVGKVIDAYPPQERIAVIESVATSTGGPALNLAVDLARLGASFPLAVAGVVGQDEHGDFVLEALAGDGIDTRGIRRSGEAATSFTDAMVVRDGGSRTFFHHVGANGLLQEQDVDLASSSARILHMGAPGLHPAMDAGHGWSRVLAAAQEAGMRTNLELVSLSPEEIRAVALPCLPHLDSIVVNEIEASALAGEEVAATGADGAPDWAALERVALRLIDLGVGTLVAVHFPAGCVAAAPGGQVWRQGSVRLPRAEIRSATGAGDAFASGVIFGLHEGWPVPDCLRAGVSVAAACLRGAGTSDGVLPLAECLALGERHGYRITA